MTPSTSRSGNAEWLIPALGVAVGLILVAMPLAAMVIQSLTGEGDSAGAATLSHFRELLTDRRFYEATLNTIIMGSATTFFSCLLGFALAWIVARTNLAGRGWFETLNLVPFFLSPYVGAISWIYLAAPYGGLLPNTFRQFFGFDLPMPNIFGMGGAVLVLTLFYTPYIYLFVLGPLKQMDGSLEDAARVHGASFFASLRAVTLPLTMPALMSGAMIVFVTSAGLFDVPLALTHPNGIRAMPTEIYTLVQYPSDFGRASAFGVIILAAALLLTLLQRKYTDKRRFDVISGKNYRPRALKLGGAGKLAAMAIQYFYILVAIVLPLTTLFLVSIAELWTGVYNPAFSSLNNYKAVLFESELARDAIRNSIILSIVGATICVAIGALQARFLHIASRRFRPLVEMALMLPLGIPAIILGVAFLIVAVRTPLYGTLTVILIAYIARFYPYATRNISSMMLSINPEMEQSARACGASFFQTMRFVVLPLLRPALIASWIMLAVIFVRELGSTILLYTRGTETLSVAIVLLAQLSTGYVAALAMVQVVLLLFGFVLLRLFRIKNFHV